ncbi:Uncharacterised protein [Salmonella enterica subsp. enterica serovar Heidelberg]|nr:Uncharacterised protein [Salmonella enterica subsp. enterica serovar Heidelberg]
MTVLPPSLMNNWHVVLKIDVFALTITCCFAKTFEEEKTVLCMCCIIMHVNTMFTGLVKSTHGVDRRHS